MKKYEVLIKESDYFIIAINTFYNTSEVLDEVELVLRDYKFNGYYIFDFLLKCVRLNSVDRFIAYKVNDGVVNYNEKYLIMENKHVINYMNDYFSKIDKIIIDSSMLSKKSKEALKREHKNDMGRNYQNSYLNYDTIKKLEKNKKWIF